MLYKLSSDMGSLAPLAFLDLADLQKREKDLENLLAEVRRVVGERSPTSPCRKPTDAFNSKSQYWNQGGSYGCH